MLNLVDVMKKVGDSAVVVAAGVALLAATDLEGPQKKKVLMDAMNKLEGDFKVDLPDNVVSVTIEIVLILGKFLKVIPSAPSQPSLPPG